MSTLLLSALLVSAQTKVVPQMKKGMKKTYVTEASFVLPSNQSLTISSETVYEVTDTTSDGYILDIYITDATTNAKDAESRIYSLATEMLKGVHTKYTTDKEGKVMKVLEAEDVITRTNGMLDKVLSGVTLPESTNAGDLRQQLTGNLNEESLLESVRISTSPLALNGKTTNANNSTFISSSSANLVVHEGAVMRSGNYNWQLGGSQKLVLAGGKYAPFSPVGHMSFAMFSNAVLQAVHSSGSLRFEASKADACWRVIGDRPSAVTGSGVNVYGESSASTARSGGKAFRVNVADVSEGVDFTVPMIRTASDRSSGRETFAWFMFEKYGKGTMALTGDGKDVRMESKLYGGTLLLAESDIMTNEVQLLGGNFAVDAGKTNALGALTASTNGMLTVGADGLLSFASFTPGANLAKGAVTIDAPLTGDHLKFNADISSSMGYFRWKDDTDATKRWHVRQAANGYLHPVRVGTIAIR